MTSPHEWDWTTIKLEENPAILLAKYVVRCKTCDALGVLLVMPVLKRRCEPSADDA